MDVAESKSWFAVAWRETRGGWSFDDGLGLHIYCANKLVLSCKGLDRFTHHPVVGKGGVVGYDDNVTNLEVGSCGSPLSGLLEVLEILSRPSPPEVVEYSLTKCPSFMQRWFRMDSRLQVSSESVPDQEMPWSEHHNPVGGVTSGGRDWP